MGHDVHAHDAQDCPPLTLMEQYAEAGTLTSEMETCLSKVDSPSPSAARHAAWIRWLGRWKRDGDLSERNRVARQLLVDAQDVDWTLKVAEISQEDAPELAVGAVEATRALAGQWILLSDRIEGIDRLGQVDAQLAPVDGSIRWAQSLAALGVIGDPSNRSRAACLKVATPEVCTRRDKGAIAEPGPMDANDVVPCSNLGHLWLQGLTGAAYATERDCMARLIPQLDEGEGRRVGAYLTMGLALSRDEPAVSAVILQRLSAILPGDKALCREGEALHRAAGDDFEARDWYRQCAVTRGNPPDPTEPKPR